MSCVAAALRLTVPFVTGTAAPPAMIAAPLTCVIDSGLPSMSLSFVSARSVTAVSSFVVKLSFIATGGSLIAITVPLTVAVSVPPAPSLTV